MIASAPKFARVEISLRSRSDIERVAIELNQLAEKLSNIAGSPDSDEAAHFLAIDKIRATSKKLRKGN